MLCPKSFWPGWHPLALPVGCAHWGYPLLATHFEFAIHSWANRPLSQLNSMAYYGPLLLYNSHAHTHIIINAYVYLTIILRMHTLARCTQQTDGSESTTEAESDSL